MESRKYSRRLRHTLTIPFIFSMIIPLVILDIFIELYHRISFPLYKIPLIKREKYIKIDRHRLKYLNWVEKGFCAYCGYANGLLQYSTVIAGDTEKYWCGIKHQESSDFIEPSHHKDFTKYGDEEEFFEKYS